MESSAKKLLPSASLVVALLLLPVTDAARQNGMYSEKTVMIYNLLEPNITMKAHCKSGDSDVEEHEVKYDSSWSFNFWPNFGGTTLFYCSFLWETQTRWFDIYDDDRDNAYRWTKFPPCNMYEWQIRKDAPCRYSFKTKKFDLCFNYEEK